jgi:hypothetical protein
MNQMFQARVERHHIELTLVATLFPFADRNIPPDKIAPILVPFGDKLFKKIISPKCTTPASLADHGVYPLALDRQSGCRIRVVSSKISPVSEAVKTAH